MSLTPIEQYELDVKNNPNITSDNSQRHALQHLQKVYIELIVASAKHGASWWPFKKRASLQGCYLWGDVGRGKTYLLDLFFNALPFTKKKRVHFYRFMQEVHAKMKRYPKRKDPLKLVAKSIARDTYVLCLDEFMVNDIADAMILAKLLEALFFEGVTLVTTSNIPPDGLYLEGLQRKSFLPAIALLEKHLEVINVDQGADYRRLHKAQMTNYYTPLAGQDDFMRAHFELISGKVPSDKKTVNIVNRNVAVIAEADKLIWFEFDVLCGQGRSNDDYLYLVEHYDTVMLSNINKMTEADNSTARRFIGLVDALYDAKVRLIVSAAVPIAKLYSGRALAFEFKRTISRLFEMQ